LRAKAFLNPTWDKNLLGQVSEKKGAKGVSTKAERQRTRWSALGLVPLRRSMRKKSATPVYAEDIFSIDNDKKEVEKQKVSAILHGLLCFSIYFHLQFYIFFFAAMRLFLLL
jgi:hypothetical protein